MRKLFRGQAGQAIVETAIVLPVVVLLLFAMLDGGRVFHAWIVVTNGAREGARAAAARADLTAVTTRVDTAMTGIDTYTIDTDNIQGTSGTAVTVIVTTDIDLVTPVVEAFFGGDVTVEGTAVMQLE